VLSILPIRKPFQLHTLPEDHTVRTSTTVKHANLIALVDVLTLLDSGLARRDLSHSNAHEAQQAEVLVISFKDDDGALSFCFKATLACFLAPLVDVTIGRGIAKPFEEWLGDVCTFNEVRLHDLTADRRVLAMVAQRRKEGVMNSATDGSFVPLVHSEYVHETIRLVLNRKRARLETLRPTL